MSQETPTATSWKVPVASAAETEHEDAEGAADSDAGGTDSTPKGGDQVQALLRKLRKTEKERDAFKQADEQRAQSQLSEVEQLKQKLTKSEAEKLSLAEQRKQDRLQHRFESAVAKAGAVDAEAAWKLVDMSSVEIDDDGKITGLEVAVADLKKKRPYLFGSPSTPVGSSGGNPPSGPPSTKVTPEQIQRMNSKDYNTWLQSQLK